MLDLEVDYPSSSKAFYKTDNQKNDILKQKYMNVNKHFAALTAGRLG